jgi:hypothetical protein
MLSLHTTSTAAAEMNKNAQLEGLRVYGLLINLNSFRFYSYDESQRKFAFDEILIVGPTREAFMADMIHGMWLLSHLAFSVC